MTQIQLPCFCLEFGKPDPNRRIPYQMVELQDLNNRPAVQELLDRFSQGGLDQRIAQLAVWHVANGVPWQALAKVTFPRSSRRGGGCVAQGTAGGQAVSRNRCRHMASEQPSLGHR